jgi:taurine--2-oxoglutarate transaminase
MPGDLDKVFFTLGGAEANENAIRIAKSMTGRQKILARYRSYHGATYATITLTGDPRRWANEPGMPGVVHVLDPYHGTQRGTDDAQTALAYLEETIMLEGPETIAAFILEPVTGTNGILIPPDGYLQGVRELCDRHGILMIADEVMSGFGRTGEWFAVNHWGVVPDIITMAKGLTSSARSACRRRSTATSMSTSSTAASRTTRTRSGSPRRSRRSACTRRTA